MPVVLDLNRIHEILGQIDVHSIINAIEQGFVAYSEGGVVVPPVGELIFDEPRGETHIKYGYIRDDDYFVVKIASGFYDNPKLGLSAGSGLMLLFSSRTGRLICIMLDEGHLTQVRTAAAGAVAARHFAPKGVTCAGILGAGVQGRLQLEYLQYVLDIREAIVWGLEPQELKLYQHDMERKGFDVRTTMEVEEVASSCRLIVTATPSCKPLLEADQIRRGTHITAMGSDTPEKQELDPRILQRADRVIVDSLSQCRFRGEAFHALERGLIQEERLVELGRAVSDPGLRRSSEDEITIVDLTGVAVQDIQITKAVWSLARVSYQNP